MLFWGKKILCCPSPNKSVNFLQFHNTIEIYSVPVEFDCLPYCTVPHKLMYKKGKAQIISQCIIVEVTLSVFCVSHTVSSWSPKCFHLRCDVTDFKTPCLALPSSSKGLLN